jgi:outer membrane protein OmpA-like peptidoglycan-associated protein
MKMKFALIVAGLVPLWTSASGNQLSAENSNYVVIGAFASQANAIHFVENAKKEHFDASFDINSNRHLFYVYVLQTGNKQVAIEQAIKLRKETSFWDSWVFSGLLGENTTQNSGDIHPETGRKLEPIAVDGNSISTVLKKEDTESINNIPPPEETKEEATIVAPKTTSVAEVDRDGKSFLFKIFRATNLEQVTGEIDIINLENQKKAVSYKGNEDVFVKTVNKSGNVALECEVFGYRKVKQVVNLNEPEATEGVVVENEKAVVPFELVRLKKGDIAVMYNVYFYKDAAIMRPESRYEITSLMEMMKENLNYEIKIHGHTNGGAAGKIIEPGESKNYFSLTGTKEGYGSAKKLSEERANIILDFLTAEGIDPKRMQVKAWGGKKPIYDKHHAQAQTNVRVEIEIIKD